MGGANTRGAYSRGGGGGGGELKRGNTVISLDSGGKIK